MKSEPRWTFARWQSHLGTPIGARTDQRARPRRRSQTHHQAAGPGTIARARKNGWDGPPFDPRVLASLLGIRVQADTLADNHDACIFPRGQQLEIVFNASRPSTRQNFSISHEIAHTLFPDGYEMIRNRHQRRSKFDPDRELEFLCDLGAAEILLPEQDFGSDVRKEGFGLSVVSVFRERYGASRQAVIRRMVQLDQGMSAAAFLAYRLKPSEAAAARQMSFMTDDQMVERKFRIEYSETSERFRWFLPKHKSVPDDSCAYRALESESVEFGRERWSIPRLPACDVEAMTLPPGDDLSDSHRAVALLQVR